MKRLKGERHPTLIYLDGPTFRGMERARKLLAKEWGKKYVAKTRFCEEAIASYLKTFTEKKI